MKEYLWLFGTMVLIIWILLFLGVIPGMDVVGLASPV